MRKPKKKTQTHKENIWAIFNIKKNPKNPKKRLKLFLNTISN